MHQRHRRLRQSKAIRNLVQENHLTAHDFIVPLFVVEGKGIKEEIVSMPGYYRYSLDLLVDEVKELHALQIQSVLLFVKIADSLKDNQGTEALNKKGLMMRAIECIKSTCPEMLVMTDVALDPYSIYGHDGVVRKNEIVNDETVNILAEMSLLHAEAGADFVAPSDMMDGRIGKIRDVLENSRFHHTGIMSYSAKYASSFYGPFRDALDSAPVDISHIPKDKKSYQMNFSNAKEALRSVQRDISEGADIVMVKPGQAYLDILQTVAQNSSVPVAAYQVSGEYALIKAGSQKGWIDHDMAIIESLMSFKRAGAQLIASYFAKDALRILRNF